MFNKDTKSAIEISKGWNRVRVDIRKSKERKGGQVVTRLKKRITKLGHKEPELSDVDQTIAKIWVKIKSRSRPIEIQTRWWNGQNHEQFICKSIECTKLTICWSSCKKREGEGASNKRMINDMPKVETKTQNVIKNKNQAQIEIKSSKNWSKWSRQIVIAIRKTWRRKNPTESWSLKRNLKECNLGQGRIATDKHN